MGIDNPVNGVINPLPSLWLVASPATAEKVMTARNSATEDRPHREARPVGWRLMSFSPFQVDALHPTEVLQHFDPALVDRVVWISANAIQHGLRLWLSAESKHPQRPSHLLPTAWTMGQFTQAPLIPHFASCYQPNNGHDSEALLADPRWQEVEGETILIVQGQEGRGLLAPALRARGAKVLEWAVYRLSPNPTLASSLTSAWQLQQPQGLMVLSIAALTAIETSLDQTNPVLLQAMKQLPLWVHHWKIADFAVKSDYQKIHQRQGLQALLSVFFPPD